MSQFRDMTTLEFVRRFADHIAFARYRGILPDKLSVYLVEKFDLNFEPGTLARQIRETTNEEDYLQEILDWQAATLEAMTLFIIEDQAIYKD